MVSANRSEQKEERVVEARAEDGVAGLVDDMM